MQITETRTADDGLIFEVELSAQDIDRAKRGDRDELEKASELFLSMMPVERVLGILKIVRLASCDKARPTSWVKIAAHRLQKFISSLRS